MCTQTLTRGCGRSDIHPGWGSVGSDIQPVDQGLVGCESSRPVSRCGGGAGDLGGDTWVRVKKSTCRRGIGKMQGPGCWVAMASGRWRAKRKVRRYTCTGARYQGGRVNLDAWSGEADGVEADGDIKVAGVVQAGDVEWGGGAWHKHVVWPRQAGGEHGGRRQQVGWRGEAWDRGTREDRSKCITPPSCRHRRGSALRLAATELGWA